MTIEMKVEDLSNNESLGKLYDMSKSSDPEILQYVKAIGENFKESGLHINMYVCEKTVKVLEFCVPYYKYVGVRTITPHHLSESYPGKVYLYPTSSNFDRFSIYGEPHDINAKEGARSGRNAGWPAIWRAVEYAKLQSSCGNSHQHQINNQLTTGLYENKDGIWYKHVKIN